MANASKKHMGAGAQGKGDGSGGMTDIPKEMIGENDVLSNRDKSRHSGERGLDSKQVQVEQYQDTATNHLEEDEAAADPNAVEVETVSESGGSGQQAQRRAGT